MIVYSANNSEDDIADLILELIEFEAKSIEKRNGFSYKKAFEIAEKNILNSRKKYNLGKETLQICAINKTTNKVIGIAVVSLKHETKLAFGNMIFIMKDYRNQNIPFHLFRNIQKYLKENGIERMMVAVDANRLDMLKFYKSLHFEIATYTLISNVY